MTPSRGRMTAPATSAATLASEARPEASGATWERFGSDVGALVDRSVIWVMAQKGQFLSDVDPLLDLSGVHARPQKGRQNEKFAAG